MATPGASAWLKGGWVTYQTSQKIDWLGVPEELIASEGVVSEAVAEAMARDGSTFEEILLHYYTGVTLTQMAPDQG